MSAYHVSTDPVVLQPDEPTLIVVTEGLIRVNGVQVSEQLEINMPCEVSGEGGFRTIPAPPPPKPKPKAKPKKAAPKAPAAKKSVERKAKKTTRKKAAKK